MTGESSLDYNVNVPAFDMLSGSSSSCNLDRVAEYYPPARSPVDMSANVGMAPARRDEGEWGIVHESELANAEISYASSDLTEYAGAISTIPQQAETRSGFHNVPESYEEQMMLAGYGYING
ncbi:hypothetical protein V6N13_085396 [Hibiscus sabdariffa]|uniref:Uncharacterized protein n=1 Tax=Hibiscus sabdariffa TaxID=183260 RepID=A0ABR2D1F7_9ROSI